MDLNEITAAVRQHPDIDDALVTTAISPHSGEEELLVYAVPSGSAQRWGRLVETATACLVEGMAEQREALRTWRDFWDALDEISVLVMARTLAQLGAFRTPEQPVSVDSLMQRCAVAPDHEPLFRQWMHVLADNKILRSGPGPDEYACSDTLSATELDEQVEKRMAALVVDGVERVFTDYFVSSAAQQVDLLRGEASPLPLLFPDGDPTLAETFYARNPISVVLNGVLAETVAKAVELGPTDRPVRILEIGAGTGATSTTVLSRLPAERTRYCFTDVSQYFTDHAKQRFAEHTFVDYAVLDLNNHPGDQGFAPESFDVIIAANVIHTARRIDHALERLRPLLTPSGLLVAIERTANTPVQMVTVGFLEGFSYYEDQRKESNLPLLSPAGWVTTLQEGGFHRIATLPQGAAATTELAEHVILAERSADDPPVARRVKLHSDLAMLLPDPNASFHILPVEQIPRRPDGLVDERSLPSPWDEA
ncbi:methyltransferase [Saccharopolyspora erythraea]|uniref:class I SAM-dependent methyltransferase n=1 Tax=Saccharopolyspora erythraea TaxID=1836 RepID=UPI001BA814DD|nr:class I SAM-dependent methyltransferase [Saccharopolyspora erythraea]QUH01868.1 methyltransferase [Saccharopolyspora erythraea]